MASTDVDAPVVTVQGLTHAHGRRPSLRGVSFQVRPGEVLGVLGPNGAGKSTLLGILCGLIPPGGGQVTVGGHDLVRAPLAARALVGLVPQEAALYPELSARDNLRFFGRLHGLTGATLAARVAEALALAGLEARADEPARRYSGGMLRRLNLVAGILHRPRLLLLDEPTVGVDPQSRRRLLDGLAAMAADGTAILLATHLLEEAEQVCSQVLIMDRGEVLAAGAPAELAERLGGGVIHLELHHLPNGFAQAAAALPGVTGAHPLEREDPATPVLAVETSGASRVLPRLMELAAAREVEVLTVQVLRPGLEGLFLHLTGKRPRE